jgi:predicted permease
VLSLRSARHPSTPPKLFAPNKEKTAMSTVFQDIRYALRQFRKSPGFTAIAVISLALAIGANTTIFSFANQMLFVKLGVPNPNQLRTLSVAGDHHMAVHSDWGTSYSGDDGRYHIESFSYPVYQQLRQHNSVLSEIFADKQLSSVNITANGDPQAGMVELVSGNFYSQMQLKPEIGRGILPSDDGAPGTGNVTLISDAFWHRAFGGSTTVIGKTISVNSIPFTVVGVNPPKFTGPDGVGASPDVYVPLSMITVLHPDTDPRDSTLGSNLWWVQLLARTKPGISDANAQAALDVALSAAVRNTMTVKKGDTLPHIVVEDGSRGDTLNLRLIGKPIHILLGFAGLVLLLACANIANLMLARATNREREMSVRIALGAGRLRILRQVLTESVLLSALGGAAGLFLGYLGRNLIPYLMRRDWKGGDLNTSFDWRVFGFTAAITLATGILFGILPAWRSTNASIHAALKEGSRSATRRRRAWSGKAIVGFQVALSTLLVMSAVFFVRTVINLNSINPGFRAQNLLLIDVNPPAKQYPSPKNTELEYRIEEAFAAVPGVKGVTAAAIPLVAGSMWNSGFYVEGSKGSSFGDSDSRKYPDLDYVGADFFSVMQIPILAGRGFITQDTETSSPVSVINQSLAHLYFPHTNPIGKRFRLSDEGPDSRWLEIVGICADTRYHDMREEPPPMHFELYRQATSVGGVTFILRTPLATVQLLPSLRNAAARIDPDLPLIGIRTQRQQIDADMQQERMFASLTMGFGILALALACVGIYGIMAYTVSQRANEIGIRLALGAARERIRAMVLRETAWLAMIGVAIGLGATLALARIIKSMLYGLKPTDPITLGCGTALLLLVAVIAGWVPSYRASQINPIDALRSE